MIYGFSRNTIDSALNKKERHCLLIAVLYRIHIGYRMMEKCLSTENYRNSFRWQLFIDTHIDISSYMLEHNIYDDETLNDTSKNATSPVKSARDQYFPHDVRFAYCGELPDLTTCLGMGNLWYNIRPRGDDLFSTLIHIFVCKPQHQKCQNRNFMKILLRYFKQFPVMITMFRMIMEVSLMGNYDHARVRPTFERRIEIRRTFEKGRSNDQELFNWMTQYEHLVYYMTKEFYTYTIVQQYVLDKMLDDGLYWDKVKDTVYSAMDIMRGMFCRASEEDGDRFVLIDLELKKIHDDSLIYLSKLRKQGFVEIALCEFNKYREKHLERKKKRNSNQDESKSIDDDHDLESLATKEVIEAMKLCARVVGDRFDNKIETKWIKCFGVSEGSYKLFRNFYYEYERLNIADNAISRQLDDLYKCGERDFHIIRHFLRLIQEHRSTREYQLTADYYTNQMIAMRSKMQLMPWEVLSEDADVFYYCPTCRNWAHPVVDDGSVKGSMNIYARGFEKALYEYADGKLYCGKPPSSNTSRKSINNNNSTSCNSKITTSSTKVNEVALNSVPKRFIQKKRDGKTCRDTELIPVHMFGICKRLDDKLWVLCETCASLIQFDSTNYTCQGHTCSFHRRDYIKSQTTETGNYRDNDDPLHDIRVQMGLTSAKITERCWFCGLDRQTVTKTQNGQVPLVIELLNDDNNQLKFQTVLMCPDDYRLAYDLIKGNNVMRKSIALQVIKSRRMQRVLQSKSHQNKSSNYSKQTICNNV